MIGGIFVFIILSVLIQMYIAIPIDRLLKLDMYSNYLLSPGGFGKLYGDFFYRKNLLIIEIIANLDTSNTITPWLVSIK